MNGPIVVWLYPSTAPGPALPAGGGRLDGVIAQGTITGADIAPTAPADYSLGRLVTDLNNGNAYVNLHTNDGVGDPDTGPGDFPGGEIRAQTIASRPSAGRRAESARADSRPPTTIRPVGDWYEIGMTLGLGVAAGLLLAGLVAAWRYGVLVSTLGALAIGAVAGLLIKGWIGLPGALVGALIGAVSASIVARGALRRGATAGGTAFLVGSASIFIAMLALIPLVGYVIAVVVPAVAARRARQEPERHAGLRSLAR